MKCPVYGNLLETESRQMAAQGWGFPGDASGKEPACLMKETLEMWI